MSATLKFPPGYLKLFRLLIWKIFGFSAELCSKFEAGSRKLRINSVHDEDLQRKFRSFFRKVFSAQSAPTISTRDQNSNKPTPRPTNFAS